MDLRVCPECNKAFYLPLNVETVVCHFCGYTMLEREPAKDGIGDTTYILSAEKGKGRHAEASRSRKKPHC